MAKMVLVTGNTFPVKDALKALGGRWDPLAKGWRVPEDKAAEALALVTVLAGTGGPTSAPTGRRAPGKPAGWRPCGYPGCSPAYCDECDGEGYRSFRHGYGA